MKNHSSGGKSFFSGWTAPQNPIITLLRRRRESKTASEPERVSFKATNENHHKQENHGQQTVQRTVKITSSSSSTLKANGSSPHNASNDLSIKKVASGFQPMKIEEYEPGHSSIAIQEAVMEPIDYNPPICKPGELCRYSESKDSKNFRIRKKTETINNPRPGFSNDSKIPTSSLSRAENKMETKEETTEEDRRHVYKNVLDGGPIPEEGLWHVIEPRKVKTLPTPSSTPTSSLLTKSHTGLPNGSYDIDSNVEQIFEDEVMNRLGRKKTKEEFEEEMRTKKKKVPTATLR